MSSQKPPALLDLERTLRVSQEDVEALRRARLAPPMSPEEYLKFSSFEPSPEALRARRGPRGEPFRL